MKFLLDAGFPTQLDVKAPAGVVFKRWDGSDISDIGLVSYAANNGFRGVIFLGRKPLEQQPIIQLAKESGIVLIVVESLNPIEAELLLTKYANRLRAKLSGSQCFLILSSGLRPLKFLT